MLPTSIRQQKSEPFRFAFPILHSNCRYSSHPIRISLKIRHKSPSAIHFYKVKLFFTRQRRMSSRPIPVLFQLVRRHAAFFQKSNRRIKSISATAQAEPFLLQRQPPVFSGVLQRFYITTRIDMRHFSRTVNQTNLQTAAQKRNRLFPEIIPVRNFSVTVKNFQRQFLKKTKNKHNNNIKNLINVARLATSHTFVKLKIKNIKKTAPFQSGFQKI